MKAPEKIYLHPDLDSIFGITERSCESEIEYVRKDAFIEKAETYLKGNLLRYIDLCERGVGISTEEFIEEFKDYMKANNSVDACYEMIMRLHELKML